MNKEKVDLLVIIPIGSKKELFLAREIIKDLKFFYKKKYYIIFIDDSPDFQLRNFNGDRFKTIWSGYQFVKRHIKSNYPKREWSVFFVMARGLIYAFNNFKFDFLQYMETDCAILNSGVDTWVYDMYRKYNFDLIGPMDDYAEKYMRFIKEDVYKKVLGKNERGRSVYLGNQRKKIPIMFLANHFISYRMVKKMVSVDCERAILSSRELNRKGNVMSFESHYSTLIRLLGGNLVFYGGMGQGGISGDALSPLLSFHPKHKRDDFEEILPNYKILHPIKGFQNKTPIFFKNKTLRKFLGFLTLLQPLEKKYLISIEDFRKYLNRKRDNLK